MSRPAMRLAIVPLALLALLVALVASSIPAGWSPDQKPTAVRPVDRAERAERPVAVAGPIELDPALTTPGLPLRTSARAAFDSRRPSHRLAPPPTALAVGTRLAPAGTAVAVVAAPPADDARLAPQPRSGGTRGPPPR